MPKAQCISSGSNSRPTSSQYPSISFRLHTKSTGSLKRNQACRQCRKRKSKCDAGRPCKACLRAHAVVVANLVKQGLPFDFVQPECCYDGDSDSQSSSPTQLTPSPVQLHDEPQDFQSDTLKQLDVSSQQICDESLFFTPFSLSDWSVPYMSADIPQDIINCMDASHAYPARHQRSTATLPNELCPPTPSLYQQPLVLPQLFTADFVQLGDPYADWAYQSSQVAALSHYTSPDMSQLM